MLKRNADGCRFYVFGNTKCDLSVEKFTLRKKSETMIDLQEQARNCNRWRKSRKKSKSTQTITDDFNLWYCLVSFSCAHQQRNGTHTEKSLINNDPIVVHWMCCAVLIIYYWCCSFACLCVLFPITFVYNFIAINHPTKNMNMHQIYSFLSISWVNYWTAISSSWAANIVICFLICATNLIGSSLCKRLWKRTIFFIVVTDADANANAVDVCLCYLQ